MNPVIFTIIGSVLSMRVTGMLQKNQSDMVAENVRNGAFAYSLLLYQIS